MLEGETRISQRLLLFSIWICLFIGLELGGDFGTAAVFRAKTLVRLLKTSPACSSSVSRPKSRPRTTSYAIVNASAKIAAGSPALT